MSNYETTYKAKEKILCCPFCRNENARLHILGYGPVTDQLRWIQCERCFSTGPSFRNTDDAIKCWNWAHNIEEECETEIKRLENEIKSLKENNLKCQKDSGDLSRW